MAFGVLGMFLGLLLEVSTHSPSSVPRISWKHEGTVEPTARHPSSTLTDNY